MCFTWERAITEGYFSTDFAYAYEKSGCAVDIRVAPEDFRVDEILHTSFAPGEHLYLLIRKRNHNTRWVAQLLAQAAGLEERDIGFSGMKDRRAVTTQWFSVPRSRFAIDGFSAPDIEILEHGWHSRKLRRGSHQGNQFVIALRNLSGARAALEQRLQLLQKHGVPNYFGPQRFGFDAGNLLHADHLLRAGRGRAGGGRRGIYLSAARAYLFNLVLSERIRRGCWREPLALEKEPSGPLWGRGRTLAVADVAILESEILAPWQHWCHGLEHAGLRQERRPLVVSVESMTWHWDADVLTLNFSLPPGVFATSVLREVADVTASSGTAVL